MPDLLILDRPAVERLLDGAALMDPLRRALIALSDGTTSVPPRTAAFGPDGLLGAMPGFLPEAGLGIKLVSVFDRNEARGLASHQALIALFDAETGVPTALMDGTHITAVRTAASAAVAASALARSDAKTLAILGAGVQGHAHLDAFRQSFDLSAIRIASRSADSARKLADFSSSSCTVAVTSFEEAVRDADIVCCCTNAEAPVIRREWLASGAHVSSVGRWRELDDETVAAGSLFVEWQGAVTASPPAGAVELQGRDPESVTEIGAVLSGRQPGRTSDHQLTIYKSTGHAVEDLAAAALVLEKSRAGNAGVRVSI